MKNQMIRSKKVIFSFLQVPSIHLGLIILTVTFAQGSFANDPDQHQHAKEACTKDAPVKGCQTRLFGNPQNRENEGTSVEDAKAGCSRKQSDHDVPGNLMASLSLEKLTKIENAPEHNGCQILVFVSFSMPEASLKSLAQEITRDSETPCRSILVMRGLYQDSFAKTAEKLKDLGIAVEINPELFDAHQITTVPTFVFVRDGKSLHRLRGNVTLTFASKTFVGQGVGELFRDGGAP
jgi:type-F conjugative transfer system pilin assembly protein TrbC